MRLTRERIIILSVLAVAVAALLLDRLTAGSSVTGPSAAAADTGDADDAAAVADGPDATLPVIPPSSDPLTSDASSVAQQLEYFRQSQQLTLAAIGDAFHPGKEWMAAQQETEAETAQGLPQYGADLFAREHSLSAVMKGSRGGCAIIDGRIVQLGDHLDGFRLVAIADHAVIMAAQGARVVLKLDTSAPAPTAPAADSGDNRR